MFFPGRKNQGTLAHWAPVLRAPGTARAKSFCFFFSRKRRRLPSCPEHRVPARFITASQSVQGRWVVVGEPGSETIIHGGEIIYLSAAADHGYKEIAEKSGAPIVSLEIEDRSAEDAFRRANIAGLIIDPSGRLHACNVRFGSMLVRPDVEAARQTSAFHQNRPS